MIICNAINIISDYDYHRTNYPIYSIEYYFTYPEFINKLMWQGYIKSDSKFKNNPSSRSYDFKNNYERLISRYPDVVIEKL